MIPAAPGGASLTARNQQQKPGTTMLLWASMRLVRRQRPLSISSLPARSRPGPISFVNRGVSRPLSTHPPWLNQVREAPLPCFRCRI